MKVVRNKDAFDRLLEVIYKLDKDFAQAGRQCNIEKLKYLNAKNMTEEAAILYTQAEKMKTDQKDGLNPFGGDDDEDFSSKMNDVEELLTAVFSERRQQIQATADSKNDITR